MVTSLSKEGEIYVFASRQVASCYGLNHLVVEKKYSNGIFSHKLITTTETEQYADFKELFVEIGQSSGT